MVKRISIAAVLAGGLLAGTLGLAGGANADSGADGHSYGAPYHDAPYYDAPYYDAQVHGRRYDAPYYGAPEVLPQSGTSVTLGPNGVRLNLPGGGAISAGPGGLGGWVSAA
jgi:hypothetical protein